MLAESTRIVRPSRRDLDRLACQRAAELERRAGGALCAPPPAGAGVKMQGPDAVLADPKAIFGANLTIWLRASKGITLAGGQVDVQLDQSGNNNTMHRPAVGPTMGAGINGNVTTEWDGAGAQELVPAVATFTVYPSAQPRSLLTQHAFTVFWVYKFTGAVTCDHAYDTPCAVAASPAFARIGFGAGIDPGNAAHDQAQAGLYDDPGGGGAGWVEARGPSVPKGQPHYAIAVFSGQTLTLYQDTAAPVSIVLVAPPTNDPTYNLDIGRNESVAGAAWQGSLGEEGTANVAASPGQITALKKWLHVQWGI